MSKYNDIILIAYILLSAVISAFLCHKLSTVEDWRETYNNYHYGDVRLQSDETPIYALSYASEQQDDWLVKSFLTGVDSNHTDTHYLNFDLCISWLNIDYVKRSSVDPYELHKKVYACLVLADVIVD